MSGPHEKLSDLEKLLAALPPRPAALDRDRLLFRAGQVSMKRNKLWPLATITLSLSTACLALLLVLQPLPRTEVRFVKVKVPVPVPVAPATSDETVASAPQRALSVDQSTEAPAPTTSYWRLQQQAFRFGVDSLPSNAAYGEEAPGAAPMEGADLSAGSRPKLIEHPSWFPFGEQ